MIFGIPFKVVCVLTGNLLVGHFSKLEIQRELDLAGAGTGNRLPKSAYRSQTLGKNRIDLGDVRTVEQVEEFRYDVDAVHTAEWGLLQDAEVHRGQGRWLQGVSATAEW